MPITQRAIAAMALEHAPTDTTHRQATWTGPHYRGGGLGADLRYHGDGESDGDLLRVFVTPKPGPDHPCRGRHPRCESRLVDGGRLTLSWAEEEPEEDPGYVDVLMQRGDETVDVLWAGDVITGDPRDQDLFIPVDTLEDIAQDPLISMTTSPEVVAAGDALEDWKGGEPDPHAGDRVPSTDRAIAHSYWLHFGGYARFHHLRPSPLRPAFGPVAIGGRFRIERETRFDPPGPSTCSPATRDRPGCRPGCAGRRASPDTASSRTGASARATSRGCRVRSAPDRCGRSASVTTRWWPCATATCGSRRAPATSTHWSGGDCSAATCRTGPSGWRPSSTSWTRSSDRSGERDRRTDGYLTGMTDLSGKTVAIIATDFFEEAELVKPRDALREAAPRC